MSSPTIATIFLTLWKRYSNELTYHWNLNEHDTHDEHPRPQFLARFVHMKSSYTNPITNLPEPHPSFWAMKFPAIVFSYTMVFLFIAIVLAVTFGVVIFRIYVSFALNTSAVNMTTSNIIWVSSVTAACIHLLLIMIFNALYKRIATRLTNFEIVRTQTEYEDSLALKIYLLQFVNHYVSIFYIAFFKGKFIGHPGNYSRFFNYRQEEVTFNI